MPSADKLFFFTKKSIEEVQTYEEIKKIVKESFLLSYQKPAASQNGL
jgi:hypothetical protein